jgi:hypothetical protein
MVRRHRLGRVDRQLKIGSERGVHASSVGTLGKEGTVDEEVFNMSVRRFLKKLGVSAQREIELAVREQLDGGDLQGDEILDATATITVTGLSRDVVVTGRISLT